MKYVLHAVFLVLFSIIQPTWMECIEVLGIKPNLFLIYTIIISCLCDKKEGAIVSFIFGFILDFLIGTHLGLNAVLMLILSFVVCDFCKRYIRDNTLFTTMIIVLIATFLYEFVYYIVAFLGELHLLDAILKVLIPESIYCSLISIPIYYIVPKREKTEEL